MAKVEGFKCDICDVYAEGVKTKDTGTLKPAGWFVLTLPKTEHDNHNDHTRDVCSSKCLITFGRERIAVERELKGTGTTGSRLPKEVTDEYDRLGLSAGERIAIGRQHANHTDEPDPDCIRCQFETKAAS